MNKITTLFLFCFLMYVGAKAQLLNPSFEAWTSYNSTYGSGSYPTNWKTSDSLYLNVSFGTSGHSAVQEGVSKCDGFYSLKLTTVSALGNIGPGFATNGSVVGLDSVIGGSPHTTRSAFLKGCYKYVPTNVDSGKIAAVLTKWNGTARDTVAEALFITYANGGLTSFQINFIYKDTVNAIQPDTILVLLASGNGLNQAVAGSYLIVDSLYTTEIIGINEFSIVQNIHLFPQPAQNELNVRVTLNQYISLSYEVADITGRKIITGNLESLNNKIDISRLNGGNYFLALRNEDGAILYTSKFIVSK
jgi:hypothetical protein